MFNLMSIFNNNSFTSSWIHLEQIISNSHTVDSHLPVVSHVYCVFCTDRCKKLTYNRE